MNTQHLEDLEAVTLSYIKQLQALADATSARVERSSPAWHLAKIAQGIAEEAEEELVPAFHEARRGCTE